MIPREPRLASSLRVLVIGYGNTLRSDDGVGPRAAEAIDAMQISGVQAIVCHQLAPELAEPLSRAELAVFVDAAVDGASEVQWRTLEPAAGTAIMAHAPDPRALLALARSLFGRAPSACWLTIPAENLGFGEELSETARRGLEDAVEKLRDLCTDGAAAAA